MGWVRCGLGIPSSVLSLPTPSEASGVIARFNTDLTENLLSAVAEFSASQASGTPTPSAPIPIVGVDKVNVTRTGKNLFSPQKAVIDSDVSTTYISDGWLYFRTSNNGLKYILQTNQQITISGIFKSESASANVIRIRARYTDNTTMDIFSYTTTDTDEHYLSGTTTSGKTVAYIYSTFTNSVVTLCKDVQLEIGSTATTYEPYNGTTALINLGGTYYGGEVDAVTGKITLTHQLISYTGAADENWSIVNQGEANQRFRLNPAYSGMSLVICSHCQLTNTNTSNWGYCRFANNYFVLTDSDNQMGSVENLKSWLATQYANGTPLSILVELATPIVVYASNTAEIPTIVGDNQVYADTGDVAVKFFETVGHKI